MILLPGQELKTLLVTRPSQCISLFLPTSRAGAGTQQAPIRLKNLLRKAEERLTQNGAREADARELLEPARKLLDDSPFWSHQSDGLAIYSAPGIFYHYQLPYQIKEHCVVGNRFYIKPLLPVLSGDGRFYVLALSQNGVRLLQGTRYTVAEVTLEDAPHNLAEAIGPVERERQLQYHTRSSGQGGRGAAIFHGQSEPTALVKQDLTQFFRQVDRELCELLGNERAPVVLAGVDYLHPLYRQISKYARVLDQGIIGNPDDLNPKELHARAWAIVEPIFLKAQRDAADAYRERAGSNRASNRIEQIAPAAYQGRVDRLFVATDAEQWGAFDPDRAQITLSEQPGEQDIDLHDFACIYTLLHGGTVFAVDRDHLPDQAAQTQTAIAAIFRH